MLSVLALFSRTFFFSWGRAQKKALGYVYVYVYFIFFLQCHGWKAKEMSMPQ